MKRSVVLLGVFVCFLLSALACYAGALEDRLNEARKLFDQGNYKDSEKIYREILSKYKEEIKGRTDLAPRLWQGLGEALMRQGKSKDAQKVLERVGAHKSAGKDDDKVEPASAAPVSGGQAQAPASTSGEELSSSSNAEVKELYRNGTAFLNDGGSKIVVINTLLEASRKEPTNRVIVSKVVGLILETTETFYKEARTLMEGLKTSLKGALTPEEKILLARIYFLVAPFKYDEARSLLNEVLKADATNLQGQIALAELNTLTDKNEDALKLFKQIEEKNPKEMRAVWGVGYALKNLGKTAEAHAAFERAYSMNPMDSANNVRMAKAQMAMGKRNLAANYYNFALEYDPNNLEAHLGIIPILLSTARDRTAADHIHVAMAMDPNNPKLLLGLGYFHEMRGNLADAMDYYEQASAFGEEAVEAKMRLARIYMGIGNSFKGKYWSNDKPDAKRLYDLCANPQRALQLLKEVVVLAPKHPEMAFIQESIADLEQKIAEAAQIQE